MKLNIFGIKISFSDKKGYWNHKLLALLTSFPSPFVFRKKYDALVPLGPNCEVGYRIKEITKHFGYKKDNYIYNWVWIIDREKFMNTLDNFNLFNNLEFNICPNGMHNAEKIKMAFHPRRQFEQLDENGNLNMKVFEECSKELQSRITHLAEKTDKLFKSDKKTLFVIKVLKTDIQSDKDYIKNVYDTIERKYLSGKFKLLVFIQDKDFNKEEQLFLKECENDKLKICNIKSFAHYQETETDGDIWGWFFNLYKELI